MFLVICQVSLRYINKLQNLIRTSPFILAKTIFCWLSTHRAYFTAALCSQMTFNCWTLFRATIITACACRSRIGCVFLCFNVTYFRDTRFLVTPSHGATRSLQWSKTRTKDPQEVSWWCTASYMWRIWTVGMPPWGKHVCRTWITVCSLFPKYPLVYRFSVAHWSWSTQLLYIEPG